MIPISEIEFLFTLRSMVTLVRRAQSFKLPTVNRPCIVLKSVIVSATNVSSVVRKLMLFTAAMVFLPLATFFACQYLLFSPLVSGGAAAAAANVVLIAYIVAAFAETIPDDGEKVESRKYQ